MTIPAWVRVALAAIGGGCFAVLLQGQALGPGYEAADLTPPMVGVRALINGEPPYLVATPPRSLQLLYPLPALLILAPFATLPLEVTRTLWSALAAAVLTFVALSRFGWHGFAVVASKCAERAIGLAQWSPWFVAGAFVPAVQLIAVAKPTLGLILFAYRPTRWPLLGAALLLPIAFAVRPTWLTEWLDVTRGQPYYSPAVVVWQGGGPLLLLAALRWRRPEARLLFAMACVPHHYVWYDQLLLFLVPAKAIEVWMLSALSWLSVWPASVAFEALGVPEPPGQMAFRAPIVALLYLPALAMVLRRPNEGSVPAWLDQTAMRWPAWLRGTT